MANAKLGSKAVGSIVKLKVGGVAKEFIVVHQGKPSSIYDDSCDGTWLLMKDVYENRKWHSSNVNKYESSDIHAYLNSTFLNLFESNIRDVIKQVKIPYRSGGGSGGSDQSGANGLPCKVFLLSGYEVGWTTSDNGYFPENGAKLSYFESGTGSSANNKRIAKLNGSAAFWWLRSATGGTSSVWGVLSNGGYSSDYASSSYGIRPCIILPSDVLVDDSGNVLPPVDLTAHKTLINGTAYTVKGGKCMVNGTVYNILKGRTLIDGTGYDITLPSAGTKLSTLDVGQSVFANVNGKKTEFLVVHQGLPSSRYDDSCNGTWLLMKDIYENRKWHSSNVNKYESSAIHSYLNSTFLNLFDSNIKGAIKQVKIPYRKNVGSGGTDQSGANGLSCKVFLLSGYEVGFTNSNNRYFPIDGAKLSYFESGNGTSANNKRIAKLNGSAAFWWLRSPYTGTTLSVYRVYPHGDWGYNDASYSYGIRPALVLPSDVLVDDEFNLIA
jgi:hypothetical protein